MPNKSGSVYGLTLLCPIIDDDRVVPSHDLQIRDVLSRLHPDKDSPFARAPGTHLARLVVLDDVIYVGMPSCEEHLKSKYLVFESNCDGDFDSYLTGLASHIPAELNALLGHCVGYPGLQDIPGFLDYMKKCQVETTFFFAPVNNKTVQQTLTALRTQRAVSDFIIAHQGAKADTLQQDFKAFVQTLRQAPPEPPASHPVIRDIKTGGPNE